MDPDEVRVHYEQRLVAALEAIIKRYVGPEFSCEVEDLSDAWEAVCHVRAPSSFPRFPSHAEQVDQRMITTSAALTQADHALRTSQEVLDRAQKAQAEALQRYQHLCRQMAEAATSWAILREKEGQG